LSKTTENKKEDETKGVDHLKAQGCFVLNPTIFPKDLNTFIERKKDFEKDFEGLVDPRTML
jgi:hypothetical protein